MRAVCQPSLLGVCLRWCKHAWILSLTSPGRNGELCFFLLKGDGTAQNTGEPSHLTEEQLPTHSDEDASRNVPERFCERQGKGLQTFQSESKLRVVL